MPEGIVGATSPDLFREWFDRFVKKPTPISLSSPEQPDLSLRKDYTPTAPPPMLSRPPELSPGAAPEQAPIDAYTPEAPGATITDRFMSGLKKFGEAGQNLSDPAKMGLLGTGLAMLATPPRREPYSNTEILGRSGLAGLGIYEKALEDKRKQQALDVSAEEHKLTREDQKLYREGLIEVGKQNAASLAEQRTALVANREANTKNEAALSKTISPETAKYYNLDPATTVREFNAQQSGLIASKRPAPTAWREVNFNGKNQWVDLNTPEAKDLAKQGAFGVKDKPGYRIVVGDDGQVTEIQVGAPEGTPPKVVAPPGTGKKTKPPSPGAAKQFQHEWDRAKEALPPGATNEQIAAKRTEMFPKGVTKTSRNPRAAMAAPAPAKNAKEYIQGATSRGAVKDRIRQMAAAGYSRKDIEDAVKGTQWE
jgi:hypothetical protein